MDAAPGLIAYLGMLLTPACDKDGLLHIGADTVAVVGRNRGFTARRGNFDRPGASRSWKFESSKFDKKSTLLAFVTLQRLLHLVSIVGT